MITMSNFGSNGRLGNQLFQYAFMFSLSKENNYDFCIPEGSDAQKCFNITLSNCKNNIVRKYKEQSFTFDVNFPQIYPDNCDYRGYYQSEKYFKKYKTELLKTFEFKQEHKISGDLDFSNMVSIHIRRGDYVNNTHYEPYSDEYLKNAKGEFNNKKYLVFSDDINWCKEMNIGYYYAENNSHYTDLYQMTLCESSIIANSSFSWWGAYLSEKEKVIAPKKWFSGKSIINDTKDLYCQEWIVI